MDPVRTLQITYPQPGDTVDAFADRLCLVAGETTPPGANYLLGAILVWGTDTNTGIQKGPNAAYPYNIYDDIFFSGDPRLEPNANGGYTWKSISQVPCSMDPAVQNAVRAQASWYDDTTYEPWLDPEIIVPVEFDVLEKPACGGLAKVSENEKLAHNAHAAALSDFEDIEPSGRRGRFLQYESISITDSVLPRNGSRLAFRGAPLRCSAIQVSAFNVVYRYRKGADPIEINRPAGPTLAPPSAATSTLFNFPTLPAWSVVIHQPSSRRQHVVLSDNRKRPDVLQLNPAEDIFVKVNIQLPLQATMEGSFGLYIDPIL
jgi:hypothetical protein